LCTRWNVRLRVPIGTASPASNPAAGLPLPDSFRMWYELHVEDAGASMVRYKWPTGAGAVDETIGLYPDPPRGGASVYDGYRP
jgi:hypothetical protein